MEEVDCLATSLPCAGTKLVLSSHRTKRVAIFCSVNYRRQAQGRMAPCFHYPAQTSMGSDILLCQATNSEAAVERDSPRQAQTSASSDRSDHRASQNIRIIAQMFASAAL